MAAYTKYLAQDINAASVVKKHNLGFRVTDQDTGAEYMYVQFNYGAGSVAAAIGQPVGIYCLANALVGSETVVTNDVTDSANGTPIGVMMSAATHEYYCWIKLVQIGKVTTVLCDTANPAQYQYYKWSVDGKLTSIAITSRTEDPLLAIAKSVDSDLALVGYQTVRWL